MDNIRIANQLVKIAKSLMAFEEDKTLISLLNDKQLLTALNHYIASKKVINELYKNNEELESKLNQIREIAKKIDSSLGNNESTCIDQLIEQLKSKQDRVQNDELQTLIKIKKQVENGRINLSGTAKGLNDFVNSIFKQVELMSANYKLLERAEKILALINQYSMHRVASDNDNKKLIDLLNSIPDAEQIAQDFNNLMDEVNEKLDYANAAYFFLKGDKILSGQQIATAGLFDSSNPMVQLAIKYCDFCDKITGKIDEVVTKNVGVLLDFFIKITGATEKVEKEASETDIEHDRHLSWQIYKIQSGMSDLLQNYEMPQNWGGNRR